MHRLASPSYLSVFTLVKGYSPLYLLIELAIWSLPSSVHSKLSWASLNTILCSPGSFWLKEIKGNHMSHPVGTIISDGEIRNISWTCEGKNHLHQQRPTRTKCLSADCQGRFIIQCFATAQHFKQANASC